MNRREYLMIGAASVGGLLSLAGCLSPGEEGDGNEDGGGENGEDGGGQEGEGDDGGGGPYSLSRPE